MTLKPPCGLSVTDDFEVAIVGTGLVGAALGLGLAQQGRRVLLVDQLARPAARGLPARDDRGLALSLSSVAVLEALQVWPQLASVAYPITQIHVSQQGHFGALRLSHRELGMPLLGYVCPAEELHYALLTALAATPGIAVRWQTRLTALRATPEGMEISLHSAEQVSHCATALLVGADGVASVVRELAGIEVQRHAYEQTAIVANIEVARPQPHTAFERFTTSGPLALLPLGGRRYVLVRSAHTAEVARLLALPDEAYLRDAQQRFGYALGAFCNLGLRRAHPLLAQRAQQVIGARSLLLGNAANAVHPNAAQGLNLGLRDVAAALAVLAEAQRAAEDLGSPAVLARFAAARKHDQQTTTRLTDVLARLFALELPLVGGLRALALCTADRLPWIKRAVLRRLALGHGHFA
jgi:2-octaprenyl-6-methoxyphenol hydroxylase